MQLEEIVKEVAETIQQEANARAVFGDPAKLETRIVIPVAAVRVSVGGKGGGGTPGGEVARFFGGGSGGFTVSATPVGFIHEKDGAVTFTRIEPLKPESLPQFAERIVAAFAPRQKPVETKPAAEKHEARH